MAGSIQFPCEIERLEAFNKGTVMNETMWALVGAIGVGGLWILYVMAVSGGNFGRYRKAVSLLKDPKFDEKYAALSAPPKPVAPPKPSGEPLRLLSLLQREGRLLDFLLENIEGYSNDQVGAAVRDIHRSCQKALQEHLVMEPILKGEEQAQIEVPTGFDPSAIRLTGNVTGEPPFKGTLQHHGWRVKEIKLAKAPEGQDLFIVAQAEVELA